MKQRAMWTAVVVILLAAFAIGQAPDQYLDVFVVQVKPEKRAVFDAISKKMVAANRQNKGDEWLAMETVYGPMNRITMTSMRQSYGDTEKGSSAFDAAMQKSMGKPGMDKTFQDFNSCLANSWSELRKRRWDLSSNAPADGAALAAVATRFPLKRIRNFGTRWMASEVTVDRESTATVSCANACSLAAAPLLAWS